MKTISIAILLFILISCGTNKPVSENTILNNQGFQKQEIVSHFNRLQNDSIIGQKPLTIIDGTPYEYPGNLQDEISHFVDLKVKKITHISIKKAIELFGKHGKEGLLLLNTY